MPLPPPVEADTNLFCPFAVTAPILEERVTNPCLAVGTLNECPPAATGFWGSQLFPLGGTGKRDRLAEWSL